MNRKQLEDYIEKLKNYEEILSSEDGVDQNFINELNNVFKKLKQNETQPLLVLDDYLIFIFYK